MLNFLFSDPLSFLIWAGALLSAITVHEFAHALAADRLGDPTPKIQGRLTLNPLAHLDPLGTLMLVLVRFGWGKPVEFDPFNLKNPRRDAAIISLAGPTSNLILASVLAIILRVFSSDLSPFSPLSFILPPFILLNISLAIFNLVPLHPLDGGKILVGLLPHKYAVATESFLARYSTILLILAILPIWNGTSPIFAVISPLINFLTAILLPSYGKFI
jgi:Zn-dependent protease